MNHRGGLNLATEQRESRKLKILVCKVVVLILLRRGSMGGFLIFNRDGVESGLGHTMERVPVRTEREGIVRGDGRGRVSEWDGDALRKYWDEAVGYARREIGRYWRWRGQKEPVLAGGYDAEAVVQAAFERLLQRQAGRVRELYSAREIRRELRVLIKHRVRWLHERSETGLVVSEREVLPQGSQERRVSLFDFLPGGSARPDEALMRKERERLLAEFKGQFETSLAGGKELLKVFRETWAGQTRRQAAQKLGTGVERVKALKTQQRRLLISFGAQVRGGVAEMLEGMKEGD